MSECRVARFFDSQCNCAHQCEELVSNCLVDDVRRTLTSQLVIMCLWLLSSSPPWKTDSITLEAAIHCKSVGALTCTCVAIWLSGSVLVSIIQSCSMPVLVSTGMGNRVRGSTPGAGRLSQYITSHPGQLSLAITPWVGAICTSQRVVMLYGWAVEMDRSLANAEVRPKNSAECSARFGSATCHYSAQKL